MVKATQEIHSEIEGREHPSSTGSPKASFGAVISQIAVMDLVFSLDSIVTAVGLARDIEIMVAAICISIGVMYAAAEPVGAFIKRHPTTKMLGLSFLILIGVALVSDGFEIHIPRGYIYFAMAFAGAVEAINIWAKGSSSCRSSATPPDLTHQPRDPSAPNASPTNKGSVPAPARNMKAQRRKRQKK